MQNPSIPEIHVTNRYHMFKHIVGNRHINMDHLISLRESILKKDLLKYNPILVDRDLGVVDGQHRLRAAEELKKDVYYIVVPDVTFNDITLLNSNLKNWMLEDYLLAWLEKGKEEYIAVAKFCKEFGVSLSNGMAILNIDGTINSLTAPYQVFKAGDFRVKDMLLSRDFAQYYLKMRVFAKENVKRDREYLRALYRIFINDEVDKDRLYSTMEELGIMITLESSLLDYLRGFEDIYNRKMKTNKTRLY